MSFKRISQVKSQIDLIAFTWSQKLSMSTYTVDMQRLSMTFIAIFQLSNIHKRRKMSNFVSLKKIFVWAQLSSFRIFRWNISARGSSHLKISKATDSRVESCLNFSIVFLSFSRSSSFAKKNYKKEKSKIKIFADFLTILDFVSKLLLVQLLTWDS